jgi:hypothetical protein
MPRTNTRPEHLRGDTHRPGSALLTLAIVELFERKRSTQKLPVLGVTEVGELRVR